LFAFWNQGRITPSLRGFKEGTLSPERAYAVAKYLLQEKLQHAKTQSFLMHWIISNWIMDFLQLSLDDDGHFLYNADFKFKYADLTETWWYRFACNNRDAVNGSVVNIKSSNFSLG